MQLFTFQKIYINDDLLTESIQNQEFSSEAIENQWYRYWDEFGQDFIISSWYLLYKDYIDERVEQTEIINKDLSKTNLIEPLKEANINSFSTIVDLNCIPNKIEDLNLLGNIQNTSIDYLDAEFSVDNLSDLTELNIDESKINKTWDLVWEEHYQEQYAKCFNLFNEIYEIAQNQIHEILTSDHLIDNFDDFAELKALGLPTNFSSTNKNYKQKIDYCQFWMNDIMEVDDNFKDVGLVPNQNKHVDLKLNEENDHKIRKKRKNRKKQIKNTPPAYMLKDIGLLKYWRKRFLLFSKFDQGIQLDRESWFSVTPEKIAIHIANKMEKFDIVVDAFCGSGGNTIQLAKKCERVIAIDIDRIKIQMAKNNAKIYQVDHKIDFIVGDFLQLCDTIKADAIFLSPPWGGPTYLKNKIYNIDVDLLPVGGTELLKNCRNITKNICIYLPKNSDRTQIIKLAGLAQKVEIEQNFFDHKIVALTAYYGDLVTSLN